MIDRIAARRAAIRVNFVNGPAMLNRNPIIFFTFGPDYDGQPLVSLAEGQRRLRREMGNGAFHLS